MKRLVAWALALVVTALASQVSAQSERRDRVIATYRVDPWDLADLSWVPGPTARVVLRGSLTCALDGSEIDALEIATASRTLTDARPLVFPEGTRLVERRGLHAYLFEVPTGAGASIALNVPALASRHLVTASELRHAITGVIVAEILADERTPTAVAAMPSAAATGLSPAALAGAVTLSVPLFALGLVLVRRRRVDREAELMARAARARSAITREAKVLGPAFDGALASARALGEAAIRQRAHLAELDRAIARTGWVRGGAASASVLALHARRDEARARLESIVDSLEETVVRMAACVADRSAIAGLERDLARARSEVEVGESVEQEIARIGAS